MVRLSKLIQETAIPFGLIAVHSHDNLDSIRQTSFTWTRSPQSLCLAINKRYFSEAAENPNIVAIVAPPAAILGGRNKGVVEADKAAELFYRLHNMGLHRVRGLPESPVSRRIATTCRIADTAVIAENVDIGEDVVIGHGCFIGENTVIGDGSVVGNKSVTGVDGFFAKRILDEKVHVKHFGGVRIGRHCRIHTAVVLSRSVNYGEYTEIGDHVHIGHHAVIGHDVSIGQGSDISVKVLLAGRVQVGRDCWIGAGAAVSNARSVGDNARVRIGAVVVGDVAGGEDVSGNFAILHHKRLLEYGKGRT